jgi:hypothetical protein
MNDISISEGKKKQRIPVYVTDTELQTDGWGFGMETCGKITYNVSMQD